MGGQGSSAEPPLGKDGPVDLLTLESTKPVDEHRKFEGWNDWDTLMNEPLHSDILYGEMVYKPIRKCSRFRKGEATISECTLFGKSSFG